VGFIVFQVGFFKKPGWVLLGRFFTTTLSVAHRMKTNVVMEPARVLWGQYMCPVAFVDMNHI